VNAGRSTLGLCMSLSTCPRRSARSLLVLLACLISPIAEAQDLLDDDTQGLETSLGHWATWYSTSVSRSTAQAASGSASLRIDITGATWGVGFNNWPGFTATPGSYDFSVSTLQGAGTLTNILFTVIWAKADGTNLSELSVSVPSPASTWTTTTQQLVAPAGTERMYFEVTGLGTSGDFFFVDDAHVVLTAPPSPPASDGGLPPPSIPDPSGSSSQGGPDDGALNSPLRYQVGCASTADGTNPGAFPSFGLALALIGLVSSTIRRRSGVQPDPARQPTVGTRGKFLAGEE